MAMTNTRVRVFQTISELQAFITTDDDITSIISISQDNSGAYVLVYNVGA